MIKIQIDPHKLPFETCNVIITYDITCEMMLFSKWYHFQNNATMLCCTWLLLYMIIFSKYCQKSSFCEKVVAECMNHYTYKLIEAVKFKTITCWHWTAIN